MFGMMVLALTILIGLQKRDLGKPDLSSARKRAILVDREVTHHPCSDPSFAIRVRSWITRFDVLYIRLPFSLLL